MRGLVGPQSTDRRTHDRAFSLCEQSIEEAQRLQVLCTASWESAATAGHEDNAMPACHVAESFRDSASCRATRLQRCATRHL